MEFPKGCCFQAAIDSVVATATDTWGADNVDSSGLVIGENLTLEGGTMTVSGSVDAGDTRASDFAAAIENAVSGLTADAAGVTVDTSPAALARAEEKLTAALVAEPILFDTGSANISAESDAILERVAAAINAAPGINVEVVGHTDDQGSGAINTALSADRASAVLDRLVELGVDGDRLTSSGKGEAEPIADNTTEEGRAANRRIEFLFEGAA
ncbi:MAG: OmpA family protein [Acidimicrobiales bacterium]